jgi:hypothetical protein
MVARELYMKDVPGERAWTMGSVLAGRPWNANAGSNLSEPHFAKGNIHTLRLRGRDLLLSGDFRDIGPSDRCYRIFGLLHSTCQTNL